MTAPVLPKTLGEGDAFFSKDHGNQTLYDVLKKFVECGTSLQARNASTITTGTKAGTVAQFDGVLGKAHMRAANNGSAGSTIVDININGTTVASLTLANTDTDGVDVSTDMSELAAAAFVEGDLIEIAVDTAPTSGSDLVVSVQMRPYTFGK